VSNFDDIYVESLENANKLGGYADYVNLYGSYGVGLANTVSGAKDVEHGNRLR
jgi:hypothetical protein